MFRYLILIAYLPCIFYLFASGYKPLKMYQFLCSKWGGRYVFNLLIGMKSPYNSTISPDVISYTETDCIVTMQTPISVQNMFGSCHAMALGNLGELASGLVMLNYFDTLSLTSKVKYRGIVTRVECDFLKKAKGKLKATSTTESISRIHQMETKITSVLTDSSDSVVCRVNTFWNVKRLHQD